MRIEIVLCSILVVGCGGGDGDRADGGGLSDAGGDGGNTYETVREAATAIAIARCERIDECGVPIEATCVDRFVDDVCITPTDPEGASCSRSPLASDREIDECIEVLRDFTCEAFRIDFEFLPMQCRNFL